MVESFLAYKWEGWLTKNGRKRTMLENYIIIGDVSLLSSFFMYIHMYVLTW